MGLFELTLALLQGSAAAADAVPTAVASTHAIAVVADADDVQSAVMRDADGHLERYAVGANVAPLWRVTKVAGGEVTLRYTRTFAGSTLEMRLHAGDTADLDAKVAALDHAAQPIAVPRAQVMTQRPPAKSTAKSSSTPSH